MPPDLAPVRMAGFLGELLDADAVPPEVASHPGLSAARADGYVAHDWLGEGGESDVWRGIDAGNTGREVAIKVRKSSRHADGGAFSAEIRALKRLTHPGVVGLIRQGGAGAAEYLVLELIDGLPIDQFVAGRGLSPSELVQLLQKVCDAVAAVHGANLVHADLKPSNILVRDDGAPVVIDFGLACRPGGEGQAVARRVVCGGTEVFLAPELRADHARPSRASDLFALAETFRRVAAASGRNLSAPLKALLDQAGAADPFDRPKSVAELEKRLAGLPAARAHPRRVGRAALLATATAAVVLAAGFVGWGAATPSDVAGRGLGFAPGPGSAARGVEPAGVAARVQTLLNAGDTDGGLAMLAGVAEADRGWEWRHLWAFATQPPVVVSRSYAESGTASVLSSAGDAALVGTASGRLYRTDLEGHVTELVRGQGMIGHLAALDARRSVAVDHAGRVLVIDGDAVEPVARVAGRPTACWPSGDGDGVLGWDAQNRQVFRVDLASGRSEVVEPTGMVLASPSSPGWVWATGPDADGPEVTQRLMGPGWQAHRQEVVPVDRQAMCVDHDAGRGATVLGTLTGALRYYPGPGGAPVDWQISDRAFTAVVLSEDERRVFAVGDAMYVFDLDREAVVLKLPLEIPGLVMSLRWNPNTAALTVASDRAMMQWKAPPADNLLALR